MKFLKWKIENEQQGKTDTRREKKIEVKIKEVEENWLPKSLS
jgi:hypothetical protein